MVTHPPSGPHQRAVATLQKLAHAGRSLQITLLVFVLFSTSLAAQPAFFEPKEGYYGAQGTLVKAKWELDRTSVPEDSYLVATLTVTGASNPKDVRRPDLAKLPEFSARFVVEDAPAVANGPNFAYRLRPRNRDVKDVPPLNFFYLNPAVKAGNPFMNARAKGVAITVTAAAPKPAPPAVPLEGPDHLFAVETDPRVLAGEPFVPGITAWVALAGLTLLVPLGWYMTWRLVYPDAARLAMRRRSRAARRALAAIRMGDGAAVFAASVLEYLRARYALPPGADTPPEAAAALAAHGVAGASDVAEFLRACDAARFAPHPDTAASLATAAEALVAQLEAVE